MEHGGTKWTDLEQAVEQKFLSKIIPVSNLSLEASSLPSVAPPPSLAKRRLISDSKFESF